MKPTQTTSGQVSVTTEATLTGPRTPLSRPLTIRQASLVTEDLSIVSGGRSNITQSVYQAHLKPLFTKHLERLAPT